MPFKLEKSGLWKQSLDYANTAYEIADRSTGQSDNEQRRFPGIQLTGQGEGPNEKGIVAEIDEKSFEDASGIEPNRTHGPEIPGDVKQTWADVSKAKELLGYSPNYDLEQGLRNFAEWYRRNRDHRKLSV